MWTTVSWGRTAWMIIDHHPSRKKTLASEFRRSEVVRKVGINFRSRCILDPSYTTVPEEGENLNQEVSHPLSSGVEGSPMGTCDIALMICRSEASVPQSFPNWNHNWIPIVTLLLQ